MPNSLKKLPGKKLLLFSITGILINTGWLKKSKLLYCVNSLLFFEPPCRIIFETRTVKTSLFLEQICSCCLKSKLCQFLFESKLLRFLFKVKQAHDILP